MLKNFYHFFVSLVQLISHELIEVLVETKRGWEMKKS